MKLIDAHSHLFKSFYKKDIDKIILESANKLKYLMMVGYSKETIEEAISISNKYENILLSIGMHPNECNDKFKKDDFNFIEKNILINKVHSIGEIGLDYYRSHDKKNQVKSFVHQMKKARKFNLPVIIHLREEHAIEKCIKIVTSKFKDLKILFHSWSGTIQQTKKLLKNKNFFFSFNGILTFKNSENQNKLLLEIPIERILLETDCPWLTPIPFRGKKNEPILVKYIYDHVSRKKNLNFDVLVRIIENNFKNFFNVE